MIVPKPPPLEPIYVREGDRAYHNQECRALMRGIKIERVEPMGWRKFKFWWHDNWVRVPLAIAVFVLFVVAVCNLGCMHHYHHMVYDPVDIEALMLQHGAIEDACERMCEAGK